MSSVVKDSRGSLEILSHDSLGDSELVFFSKILGRMMDIWEMAGESFNDFKYLTLFGRDPFILMVLVFCSGTCIFKGKTGGTALKVCG